MYSFFFVDCATTACVPNNRPPRKQHKGEEAALPSASTVKKRTGYISWEEYFMAVAFLSAQRSKDPSSQVKWMYYVALPLPSFPDSPPREGPESPDNKCMVINYSCTTRAPHFFKTVTNHCCIECIARDPVKFSFSSQLA